ncbi:tetratricopeptide repeat protein [Ectothiorhodospiraceae bacterium BW-2]|nr:tetratricopeptide repeat protein [Ectothiorhodospiraceae bacterium BW-2]
MRCLRALGWVLWLGIVPVLAVAESDRDLDSVAAAEIEQLEEPLFNPFVERYVLDELKQLRTELQQQRTDFVEQLARSRLENSDRTIRYATDTINNIFYLIATAVSIMALVGWSSLRDIRNKMDEVIERKVVQISEEYQRRLVDLEQTLRDRTEQIISTQEEISRTNTLHSLWMRSGIEVTPQAKIEVYDQILAINPEDIEALTYKADTVLELGEAEWALNLCNQALSIDENYPYAYYQRACTYSTLQQCDAALEDLRQAVSLSATYLDEARTDSSLAGFRASGKLDELIESLKAVT